MKNSAKESLKSVGAQAGECPLPSTKTPQRGSSGIPHLAGESEDSGRLQLFSLLGLCTADVPALGEMQATGSLGPAEDSGEGKLDHCECKEGWQGQR